MGLPFLGSLRRPVIVLILAVLMSTFGLVLPCDASSGHSSGPGWRVLYFWSSTCPCVKACERYSLVPLARKYRGRVSFVAVASDGYDLAMPRAQLDALITEHHLPYPVILDTTHRLALTYRARVTPQTIVLDPAGNVVFDGMPDDSRRFIYDVDALSGHRSVPDCYLSRALSEGLAGKAITEQPPKEAGCAIAW